MGLLQSAVVRNFLKAPTHFAVFFPDVLAAGNALGRAGEWKSLCLYLQDGQNSARLGQPLVAAAMQACLLNDRAQEALHVFSEATRYTDVSSEWQWGGGSQTMDPVVRDMAMRAASPNALELFRAARQEESDLQVSVEAVEGVLRSCHDNWDGAVSVMNDLLDLHSSRWLVDGAEMSVGAADDNVATSTALSPILIPGLTRTLATFVHICIAHNQCGVALMACRFVQDMISQQSKPRNDSTSETHDGMKQDNLVIESLATLVTEPLNEELLVGIMTALAECGCSKEALGLYEAVSSTLSTPTAMPIATDFFERIQSVGPQGPQGGPWLILLHQAIGLTQLTNQIGTHGRILLETTAKIIKACSAAGQPEAGLFFSRHLLALLSQESLRERSRSQLFFGVNNDKEKMAQKHLTEAIGSCDTLLAATMQARLQLGEIDEAQRLYNECIGSVGDASYPHSSNQAIRTYLEVGNQRDAMSLFRKVPVATPDIYVSLATSFEKNKEWEKVGDLYHLALKQNCLSEELGVQAMASVCETNFDGKMPVLRRIVKEVSRLSGLQTSDWQKKRYWLLKRRLGWRFVRLLMWWNDNATAPAFELELAMDQFEERLRSGLQPKNDVLRTIVVCAKRYKQLETAILKSKLTLPLKPNEWLDVLGPVIVAAEKASLWSDSRFIEHLVEALITLDAHQEAVEILCEALARGVRINQEVLDLARNTAARYNLDLDESSSSFLLQNTEQE